VYKAYSCRPESRWIDGVEEDAKNLACRNWLADAQDICLERPRFTQNCRADDDDDDDDDKKTVKLEFCLFFICLFGNKSRITKPENIGPFLNLICS